MRGMYLDAALGGQATNAAQDGKLDLVQAASVSIHGMHGQHIENVHLLPYATEDEFWETLYKTKYSRLISTAADFVNNTGGPGSDVIVFIRSALFALHIEYSIERIS